MQAVRVSVLLSLGVSGVSQGQQRPTFNASTAAVRLEVTVFDGDGLVGGLAARDFDVMDSGRPQIVAVQQLLDVPLDVVIVAQPFASYWGEQLRSFPLTVQTFMNHLRPTDRLGLIVAGLPPIRLRPLLDGVPAYDAGQFAGTAEGALLDAIGAGLAEFPVSDRRQVLVVVSDGVDRRSLLSADMVGTVVKRSKPQVILLGQAPTVVESIKIQAVPAGPSGSRGKPDFEIIPTFKNKFPAAALRTLAEDSGGRIIDLLGKDPRELVPRVTAALRGGYLLTYPSEGVKGWHPVSVNVRRRGVSVIARAGYYVD